MLVAWGCGCVRCFCFGGGLGDTVRKTGKHGGHLHLLHRRRHADGKSTAGCGWQCWRSETTMKIHEMRSQQVLLVNLALRLQPLYSVHIPAVQLNRLDINLYTMRL